MYTMYAISTEPIKLPMYEQDQLFMSCIIVTFFSCRADVTAAVLPVNRSLPEVTTINRPRGRPKAPMISFANPGFSLAISKQWPPMKEARNMPKPICMPATTALIRMLVTDASPFAVPKATNLLYVSGGVAAVLSAFTTNGVARARTAGFCAVKRGLVVPNTFDLVCAGWRALAMLTRARPAGLTRTGVRMLVMVLIAIDIAKSTLK
mmetsp:Transcript_2453/g.5048  ORF Transcript_2453/g.5048 Transcript_2453/m.5048 type:complete len:207 (-) Transcript_2453:118-738(-)